MALLDIIKAAGLGAVDAGNPVAVLFGTVKQTNPLEVLVDQRLTLTEDLLVLLERAKVLDANDTVALLRVQGGQQFVVLDRVVE